MIHLDYVFPPRVLSSGNQSFHVSLSLFLSFSCLVTPLRFAVFTELLQGSYQSAGCKAPAQPLGRRRSDGRCSFLKSDGSPCGGGGGSSWTPPAPTAPTPPPAPSPIARPSSQPRHSETRPRAHAHHPRANPFLPLLTHHPLTSAGQEQSL